MTTTYSPALEAALLAVASMSSRRDPGRRDPETGAVPSRRRRGGASADAGAGEGAARRRRGPRAGPVAPASGGAVTTET